MKLDDVLNGDAALLHMERYVDEGARSYSRFAGKSEVAARFRPRTGWPSFELVTVIVPPERIGIFEASPRAELAAHDMRPEGVLFAVHPETWDSPGSNASMNSGPFLAESRSRSRRPLPPGRSSPPALLQVCRRTSSSSTTRAGSLASTAVFAA